MEYLPTKAVGWAACTAVGGVVCGGAYLFTGAGLSVAWARLWRALATLRGCGGRGGRGCCCCSEGCC